MFTPTFRGSLVASLASLVCAAATLSAQNTQTSIAERVDQVLRGIDRGHYIGEVAVSPDGKRLAWIQGARGGAEIRLAPIDQLSKSIRVTAASSADQHCRESKLAWSPDSAALAFLSDCENPSGQMDIYLAPTDGGAAHPLSDLKGEVGSLAFSPDGRAIAFLYVEGATRPAGALAAMKSPSGVIGEDGVEIQRVAMVSAARDADAEPGDTTFITPAKLHAYEFSWSADSKSIAYTAAEPPGENNWWVAKLYTQKIDGQLKVVLDPMRVPGAFHGLQMAVPRWSPDGKMIAFIGGLMSDQGSTGGDVWEVSSAGSEPHNLTPNRLSTPVWIKWDTNRSLFFTEVAGGGARLIHLEFSIDARIQSNSAGAANTVFSYPGTIGNGRIELGLSATADSSLFVFNASSYNNPPEIFAARYVSAAGMNDSTPLQQLTHLNEGIQQGWGKTISVEWTSDAFHVQGWLIFPKPYDPSKKYPLVVEVHGGPASAVMGHWDRGGGGISATSLSALGYFVLLPNPRGSFGQGEAFTQANRKDFGYGDLRDILAGVDTVLKSHPIDPNRVGLTGWSYGGFMSMFAVTQTHRFKAAVAGAGISNWQSYYGENSIDTWMIPYFGGSVYDDPAIYAKSSAMTFIKQVKTPTLVVVGDRDGECPAPQSFEFWHALRDLHVPTQLVVYPNEGHGFTDASHRRDVLVRAADWFARYMPPSP
jgi:dipeptidyl aminopeptidase/acylaminoacyl peptidase